MIDFVSMRKELPISPRSFRQGMWDRRTTEDGTTYYWHKHNNVTIRYYFSTHRLIISGKLITLLHSTQVQNFDDIYGGLTETFINDFNERVNRLFTKPLIDIREFTVTRIDYCFNVETAYVKEYLSFLTKAFQRLNTGKRVDHTERHGLEGSVYIKNTAEYNANARKNYTLNVYDKTDRLKFQEQNGIDVEKMDFILAENILRIEVQASYEYIKSLCKHFKIEKLFGNLFDFNVAFYAIETAFKRIFHLASSCDFYTYGLAKTLIPSGAAQKALRSSATNHNISGSSYDYARKRITQCGVYPYCLLSKDSPVDTLKNPMQLIYEKTKYYV